ncbi:hypothetical protein LXL04_032476 [Taraxacum kok-saghyz]
MQELYGASGYFKESESQKTKTTSGDAKLTEVSVSDKLEEFRAAKEHFLLSHQLVLVQTVQLFTMNQNLKHMLNSIQYLDGKTDITRTVHFGKPSQHEKKCYTDGNAAYKGRQWSIIPKQ